MSYGNRNIDYALRAGLIDAVETGDYAEERQLRYNRKRSATAHRRRGRRRTATAPGCGIGARRNRRFHV